MAAAVTATGGTPARQPDAAPARGTTTPVGPNLFGRLVSFRLDRGPGPVLDLFGAGTGGTGVSPRTTGPGTGGHRTFGAGDVNTLPTMAVFGLPEWVVGLIALLIVLAVVYVVVSSLGEEGEMLELAMELFD